MKPKVNIFLIYITITLFYDFNYIIGYVFN